MEAHYYRYERHVGDGAYGAVHACVDPSGELVAVKQCKHTDNAQVTRLLHREIRMLRSLPSHPCVVKLIDAFRSRNSGRIHLVFELMERSLSQELEKHVPGRMQGDVIKLIALQIILGLAHCHQHQVLHRDVKPANVLLSGEGPACVAKLCDFGFARFMGVRGGLVGDGSSERPARYTSYVVTRWYRAPEVLVGDIYGAPSDIWSLGCTLAELASGAPLLPGSSSLDQLARIMRCLGPLPARQAACALADCRLSLLGAANIPRTRTLADRLQSVDAGLLDVISACLTLEPQQRPTANCLLQMPYFHDIPRLLAAAPPPLQRLLSLCSNASNSQRQPPPPPQPPQPLLQPQGQPLPLSKPGAVAIKLNPADSASAASAAEASAPIRAQSAETAATAAATASAAGGGTGAGSKRKALSTTGAQQLPPSAWNSAPQGGGSTAAAFSVGSAPRRLSLAGHLTRALRALRSGAVSSAPAAETYAGVKAAETYAGVKAAETYAGVKAAETYAGVKAEAGRKAAALADGSTAGEGAPGIVKAASLSQTGGNGNLRATRVEMVRGNSGCSSGSGGGGTDDDCNGCGSGGGTNASYAESSVVGDEASSSSSSSMGSFEAAADQASSGAGAAGNGAVAAHGQHAAAALSVPLSGLLGAVTARAPACGEQAELEQQQQQRHEQPQAELRLPTQRSGSSALALALLAAAPASSPAPPQVASEGERNGFNIGTADSQDTAVSSAAAADGASHAAARFRTSLGIIPESMAREARPQPCFQDGTSPPLLAAAGGAAGGGAAGGGAAGGDAAGGSGGSRSGLVAPATATRPRSSMATIDAAELGPFCLSVSAPDIVPVVDRGAGSSSPHELTQTSTYGATSSVAVPIPTASAISSAPAGPTAMAAAAAAATAPAAITSGPAAASLQQYKQVSVMLPASLALSMRSSFSGAAAHSVSTGAVLSASAHARLSGGSGGVGRLGAGRTAALTRTMTRTLPPSFEPDQGAERFRRYTVGLQNQQQQQAEERLLSQSHHGMRRRNTMYGFSTGSFAGSPAAPFQSCFSKELLCCAGATASSGSNSSHHGYVLATNHRRLLSGCGGNNTSAHQHRDGGRQQQTPEWPCCALQQQQHSDSGFLETAAHHLSGSSVAPSEHLFMSTAASIVAVPAVPELAAASRERALTGAMYMQRLPHVRDESGEPMSLSQLLGSAPSSGPVSHRSASGMCLSSSCLPVSPGAADPLLPHMAAAAAAATATGAAAAAPRVGAVVAARGSSSRRRCTSTLGMMTSNSPCASGLDPGLSRVHAAVAEALTAADGGNAANAALAYAMGSASFGGTASCNASNTPYGRMSSRTTCWHRMGTGLSRFAGVSAFGEGCDTSAHGGSHHAARIMTSSHSLSAALPEESLLSSSGGLFLTLPHADATITTTAAAAAATTSAAAVAGHQSPAAAGHPQTPQQQQLGPPKATTCATTTTAAAVAADMPTAAHAAVSSGSTCGGCPHQQLSRRPSRFSSPVNEPCGATRGSGGGGGGGGWPHPPAGSSAVGGMSGGLDGVDGARRGGGGVVAAGSSGSRGYRGGGRGQGGWQRGRSSDKERVTGLRKGLRAVGKAFGALVACVTDARGWDGCPESEWEMGAGM